MGKNPVKRRLESTIRVGHGMLWPLLVLCLWAGAAWGDLPNDKMNYFDYYQTNGVLQGIEYAYPDIVTLKQIGWSYDYDEYGYINHQYGIFAIRIGPVGQSDFDDQGDVMPSILLVGGIHGREWLTSESLLRFASHLAIRAGDPETPEHALLRRVAVWIIPIANPAGRMIDDTQSGDPFSYFRGYDDAEDGWRHSADRRGCKTASDIARNFPTDWGTVPNCEWTTHFQGVAPFSNHEAAALRQFVQNHWVAMAVDVHAYSQQLWNISGSFAPRDRAGAKTKERAIGWWSAGLHALGETLYGSAPDEIQDFVKKYDLDDTEVGVGSGQFTAWLYDEPHIQTFMFELPPNKEDYENENGSVFRHLSDDPSNSFHPSSSRVVDLIHDCFFPVAKYLVAQADAPWSATTFGYRLPPGGGPVSIVEATEPGGSYERDYGILAAKIGSSGPGAPGDIISMSAWLERDSFGNWLEKIPAFDWLDREDSHELFYWVQNYGNSRYRYSCNVELELRSRPYGSGDTVPWTVDASEFRTYRLAEREKVFDSFPFELEDGRDYELSVSVSPTLYAGNNEANWDADDQFSPNNSKVFRFTTAPECNSCDKSDVF